MGLNFLYHHAPSDLRGTVLYPLNALKEMYPDLYAREVAKYKGREQVMQQRIPYLNCLWNDVLHFSVVPPQEVRKALRKAGDERQGLVAFYKVDPFILGSRQTIVYLYSHVRPEDKLKESNFAPYVPDELDNYAILPQETKDYYTEMLAKGERPLLYHRVPHVLTRDR